MKVAVAFSPRAGVAFEWPVEVEAPATALDAIRASGLVERFPQFDVSTATIGVWGRACAFDTPVKEDDRIELYRPLAMDPNEARRLRAREVRRAKRG